MRALRLLRIVHTIGRFGLDEFLPRRGAGPLRWGFRLGYPMVSRARPRGERLRLVITSADGVHGVEIKKFKIKKEVPRGGEAVTIEFTATTEGTFPILCSEYCGDGHNDMTGMLIVRSAPDASR